MDAVLRDRSVASSLLERPVLSYFLYQKLILQLYWHSCEEKLYCDSCYTGIFARKLEKAGRERIRDPVGEVLGHLMLLCLPYFPSRFLRFRSESYCSRRAGLPAGTYLLNQVQGWLRPWEVSRTTARTGLDKDGKQLVDTIFSDPGFLNLVLDP